MTYWRSFGGVGSNKYHAKKTEYDGIVYDSIAEARYAQSLDLMVISNEVTFWLRQVNVRLGKDFATKVDFLVFERDAVYFVEVKGVETSRWRLIKRLWGKYGPLSMKVVKGGRTVEVLDPMLGLEGASDAHEEQEDPIDGASDQRKGL